MIIIAQLNWFSFWIFICTVRNRPNPIRIILSDKRSNLADMLLCCDGKYKKIWENLTKSATMIFMRYCGFGDIYHEICNQEIFCFWCIISHQICKHESPGCCHFRRYWNCSCHLVGLVLVSSTICLCHCHRVSERAAFWKSLKQQKLQLWCFPFAYQSKCLNYVYSIIYQKYWQTYILDFRLGFV